MQTYTDQTGNTISLTDTPKRIISLVPSQSEFLWDLGLKNELVGITKFCIHPQPMFQSIERVGGTKKLDIKKIRTLKPDLIIGNKEENERSDIEALQKEFNVWMSDISNFDDALVMMNNIGKLTCKEREAQVIAEKITKDLSKIKDVFKNQNVAYFIWYKPYMLAASNTFIDHVLRHIGFENAISDLKRYPELDVKDLKRISPEICFLSSEPFPFEEKHIQELQKLLPDSKILIVDGEVFSWYGSRLLHLEHYISEHLLKKISI